MGNAYRSVLALKPTGDAVPANVLAGKTFSNAAGVGKTGTMVNNGAVSITLTDQDPTYTIPEGYHNGSGVVGFSASGGNGADLIVTCSSSFAGSVITCTDGSSYTKTQTCPSSSPYEVTFESIPTGTYTISGVVSGQTFSTTKTILDFDASLIDIPDGSTVTPTDDIQIWLHCANIWDKAYTTISQVIADASTLQALIANNNAVDYMARSTTWASNVTADSNAMSYIGLNDYCSDALLANSTWLNAICNSTYFESVLNVKVPTMTSNTAPYGTASASHIVGTTFDAYKAFDNIAGPSASGGWVSGQSNVPQWVQYAFTSPVSIKRANIIFNNINSTATIKISASTDNSNFTDLIDNVSVTGSENKQVNIENNNSYLVYRLTIISQSRNQGTVGQVDTLQFYGRA